MYTSLSPCLSHIHTLLHLSLSLPLPSPPSPPHFTHEHTQWKWTILHSIGFRRGHEKPFTKEEYLKRMERIFELLMKNGADPFIGDRVSYDKNKYVCVGGGGWERARQVLLKSTIFVNDSPHSFIVLDWRYCSHIRQLPRLRGAGEGARRKHTNREAKRTDRPSKKCTFVAYTIIL